MDTTKVFLGPLCKRGHDFGNTGKSLRYIKNGGGTCVECKRLQSKKWSQDHAIHHKELKDNWYNGHKEHHAEWKVEYRKGTPFKTTFHLAKGRFQRTARKYYAKFKDLPYDLDEQFLEALWEKQQGRCYWLDVEISFHHKARHPLKATLDRIDSLKGYTKDNVVWASGLANMGRRDTPAEEFASILLLVRESLGSGIERLRSDGYLISG